MTTINFVNVPTSCDADTIDADSRAFGDALIKAFVAFVDNRLDADPELGEVEHLETARHITRGPDGDSQMQSTHLIQQVANGLCDNDPRLMFVLLNLIGLRRIALTHKTGAAHAFINSLIAATVKTRVAPPKILEIAYDVAVRKLEYKVEFRGEDGFVVFEDGREFKVAGGRNGTDFPEPVSLEDEAEHEVRAIRLTLDDVNEFATLVEQAEAGGGDTISWRGMDVPLEVATKLIAMAKAAEEAGGEPKATVH